MNDIEAFASGVFVSEEEIIRMRERLFSLDMLKKKYQKMSIEELITYRDELEKSAMNSEVYRDSCLKREARVTLLKKTLIQKAQTLNNKRKVAGEKFSREVRKELHELGFLQSAFTVCVDWKIPENALELSRNASVSINFLISSVSMPI